MDIAHIFEQTDLSIQIHHLPDGLPSPSSDATNQEKLEWAENLEGRGEREVCFYDEKLIYVCKMAYRADPLHRGDWRSSLDRIFNSVKITTTCSFLPSLPPSQPLPPSSHPHSNSRSTSTTTSSSRSHPSSSIGLGISTTPTSHPPLTPIPQPEIHSRHSQYAGMEGVQVLEVGLTPGVKAVVVEKSSSSSSSSSFRGNRSDGGGGESQVDEVIAYFVGEVGLTFASVEMDNPVLALTCRAILREKDGAGVKRQSVGLGISGEEEVLDMGRLMVEGGGRETRVDREEFVTVQMSQERDVLGNLAGGSGLPVSCIFPFQPPPTSLHLPIPRLHRNPSVTSTIHPSGSGSGTTILQKSFRAILPILSVITVRMRTLPVACVPSSSKSGGLHPQTPGGGFGVEGDERDEDGLAATICIEVEAGQLENNVEVFEIQKVNIVAGDINTDAIISTDFSTTSKPTVRLALGTSGEVTGKEGEGAYFPFDVRLHDQHNLVYNITAEAGNEEEGENSGALGGGVGMGMEMGKGEGSSMGWLTKSRSIPLRIDISGRVRQERAGGDVQYLHQAFTSTWNTIIELKPIERKNRITSFRAVNVPASAVGRPTSLASQASARGSLRGVSGLGKNALAEIQAYHRDLVVSASVIRNEDAAGGDDGGEEGGGFSWKSGDEIEVFEVFYVELTILNVSGRTVRLKARSRAYGEGKAGNTEEAIIFLEEDILLPPLLPRSCQMTRIRCMAMDSGVHGLPVLQLVDGERDLVTDLEFDVFVRVGESA